MGQGDRAPPRDFWSGNFSLPTRKKEARKKGKGGENWEEKKENCKKEGGKLKMEGGKVTKWGNVTKWGEDFFFFFFAFDFSKLLKFVLGIPKWKFSTRKKHFTPGKNLKIFPVTSLTFDLSWAWFVCYLKVNHTIWKIIITILKEIVWKTQKRY